MRQAAGSASHSLQVQSVATLQVLVRDGAQPIGGTSGRVKKSVKDLRTLSQHSPPIPGGDGTGSDQSTRIRASASGADMG